MLPFREAWNRSVIHRRSDTLARRTAISEGVSDMPKTYHIVDIMPIKQGDCSASLRRCRPLCLAWIAPVDVRGLTRTSGVRPLTPEDSRAAPLRPERPSHSGSPAR